jgi:hypothetical protein
MPNLIEIRIVKRIWIKFNTMKARNKSYGSRIQCQGISLDSYGRHWIIIKDSTGEIIGRYKHYLIGLKAFGRLTGIKIKK